MKIFKLLFVGLMLCAIVVSCGNAQAALIGTWEASTSVYEFQDDGEVVINGQQFGTNRIEESSRLRIYVPFEEAHYDFAISGDTLTLAGEDEEIVLRKRSE